MIRYALVCGEGHGFEAWFASSAAYDEQAARGLVSCPMCGGSDVRKQIMAPAIARGSRGGPGPQAPVAADAGEAPSAPSPEIAAAMERAAAAVREHIAQTHEDVGGKFADTARAMHHGEIETKPIYGEAAPEEARALREEGVPAAPLPDAFAPKRRDKLN